MTKALSFSDYARPLAVLKWTWLCLGLIIGIDALWMWLIGIHFAWTGMEDLLGAVFVLSIASFHAGYLKPNPPMLIIMLCFMLALVGAPATSTFCYLCQTLNLPLVDAQLIAIDHALGFDWLSYLAWVARHPPLAQALTVAYISEMPQIFLIMLGLALMWKPLELQRFVLTALLAVLITVVLAALFPAVAGYMFYNLDPATLGLHPAAARSHAHDVLALRAGTLREFSLHMRGLVTFPSFHTTMALLLVWFAWPLRLWFPTSVTLNALMIMSTMVDGGHWLADVIGGIAVAMIVVPLAYILLPETACHKALDPVG